MGRYDTDDTDYHGAQAGCSQCGETGAGERLEHNGALFCVIHDNPDVGEGTWFTHWGETYPGDGEPATGDQGEAQ